MRPLASRSLVPCCGRASIADADGPSGRRLGGSRTRRTAAVGLSSSAAGLSSTGRVGRGNFRRTARGASEGDGAGRSRSRPSTAVRPCTMVVVLVPSPRSLPALSGGPPSEAGRGVRRRGDACRTSAPLLVPPVPEWRGLVARFAPRSPVGCARLPVVHRSAPSSVPGSCRLVCSWLLSFGFPGGGTGWRGSLFGRGVVPTFVRLLGRGQVLLFCAVGLCGCVQSFGGVAPRVSGRGCFVRAVW